MTPSKCSMLVLCLGSTLGVLGDEGSAHAQNASAPTSLADEMLNAHNKVRAGAPGANPPLSPFTWSVDLASQAQLWANKCQFGADPALRGKNLGENIAMVSGTKTTSTEIVNMWASEVKNFKYGSRDNALMKVGHYTQIVWRDTTQVGCAMANCKSGGDSTFWVCNYSPGGNQNMAKPY